MKVKILGRPKGAIGAFHKFEVVVNLPIGVDRELILKNIYENHADNIRWFTVEGE